MKLSIAIADTNALPNTFVVYRGFKSCIPKAAKLGYEGVELALKRADEINPQQLQTLLAEHQMTVSCISTGQVYAADNLLFIHENEAKRNEVKHIFRELIDLAGQFGQIVNIGRVRGHLNNHTISEAEDLFVDVAQDLCDYALTREVTLVLEPVNRYEIDFINSVEEGVALIKKVNRSNMKLMPDVFHMNIEDRTIGTELARHIDFIQYIHFADSNRLAPGQGHLDFSDIFDCLFKAEYDGWISTEILPIPDPDTAARQAAEFLLPLIKMYNQRREDAGLVFKDAHF